MGGLVCDLEEFSDIWLGFLIENGVLDSVVLFFFVVVDLVVGEVLFFRVLIG